MLCRADARAIPLADGSVQCCVTSPPYYGLRDYGVRGQIGMEPTPEDYVASLVACFREVRRVLRDDGTLWLNLGDSYYTGPKGDDATRIVDRTSKQAGHSAATFNGSANRRRIDGRKPKDLIGVPWRVAFALQADGWWLRSDIVWNKPNPMPESVRDRPTRAHEYLFLLARSERYYYDADAIAEPSVGEAPVSRMRLHDGLKSAQLQSLSASSLGTPANRFRNRRTVWTVATSPYSGVHFAPFPEKLVEPCILAGCPRGGIMLDPFGGTGTAVRVANRLGRRGVGLDLSARYLGDLARARTNAVQMDLP